MGVDAESQCPISFGTASAAADLGTGYCPGDAHSHICDRLGVKEMPGHPTSQCRSMRLRITVLRGCLQTLQSIIISVVLKQDFQLMIIARRSSVLCQMRRREQHKLREGL